MAVPKYNEFFPSFLIFLGDGKEHSIKEIREHYADNSNLSVEDRNATIPSGKNLLIDRVGWAKTHLKKADLIDKLVQLVLLQILENRCQQKALTV